MLRMYECNWCKTKQAIDDSYVITRQAGDRMATEKASYCYRKCRSYGDKYFRVIMKPMTKNELGDWVVGDGSKSRNRVVPPIMWH